ncbi:MAG TPA: hypothetical protein DIW82_02705 [Corynebacterium nuruki]|uniref:Uncharacterized protein n=1 Tax=Corynebacterium nuruki TaxID=1032851 RepID=A0A3D4SWW4_9CORY|nr:hypothetical protein [Corynebacterium nuruki]
MFTVVQHRMKMRTPFQPRHSSRAMNARITAHSTYRQTTTAATHTPSGSPSASTSVTSSHRITVSTDHSTVPRMRSTRNAMPR